MRRRGWKREKSVTRHDLLEDRNLELALLRRGGLGVGWGGMDAMGAPHLTHLLLTCFLKKRFTSLLWPHKTSEQRRRRSQNNDESHLSSLMQGDSQTRLDALDETPR